MTVNQLNIAICIAVGIFGLNNVNAALSPDPRLNVIAIDEFGSPMAKNLGNYDPNSASVRLPAELGPAAQDILLALGGAAQQPQGVNAQARTPGTTPALLPREGQVGTFDQLSALRIKGDNLTPHHMPPAAFMEAYGVSRGAGISMFMEQPSPGVGGRHRMTASYGSRPDFTFTPRDTLAREIRDVRDIYIQQGLYTPQIRDSLRQVIQLNLNTYPNLFMRNNPALNLPQPGGPR